MSLKYGILGLLNYQPLSGYDIIQLFKGNLFFLWNPQPSQIYRELSTMQTKGWITSDTVLQLKKPAKNIFTLTETGNFAFRDWLLNFPLDQSFQEKNPWLMRIFLAGAAPYPINLTLLEQYKTGCLNEYQNLSETLLSDMDSFKAELSSEQQELYWKLAMEYSKQMHLAGIRWANQAIKIVQDISG